MSSPHSDDLPAGAGSHQGHLRPSQPVAAEALLPGDPGRALALASHLLVKPLMANHARGLWGYHGTTEAGEELSVQATGIGGASAAVVLTELAGLGLERAVRVGTCRALAPQLKLGQIINVSGAIAEEGSAGAEGLVASDPALATALMAEGTQPVTVASTDRYYDWDRGAAGRRLSQGAVAVDMGTATLFAGGPRLDVAVGCLLVVAEVPAGVGTPYVERRGTRIEDEALAEAAERMGELALAGLAATR